MAKDSGNRKCVAQLHTFIMLPSISVRQASPYLDFKLMNHLSSFTRPQGTVPLNKGLKPCQPLMHFNEDSMFKGCRLWGFLRNPWFLSALNPPSSQEKELFYLKKNPKKVIFKLCTDADYIK